MQAQSDSDNDDAVLRQPAAPARISDDLMMEIGRPCGLGQNVADAGAVVRAEGDRELVLVHPSRC